MEQKTKRGVGRVLRFAVSGALLAVAPVAACGGSAPTHTNEPVGEHTNEPPTETSNEPPDEPSTNEPPQQEETPNEPPQQEDPPAGPSGS